MHRHVMTTDTNFRQVFSNVCHKRVVLGLAPAAACGGKPAFWHGGSGGDGGAPARGRRLGLDSGTAEEECGKRGVKAVGATGRALDRAAG